MKDSCRCRQLKRVLALARALTGRRYIGVADMRDLAVAYGVSTRTIRRDLRALEDAGWMLPRWRFDPETVRKAANA